MADKSIPPPIIWAQRADRVYVTIQVEDLKDPQIDLTEEHLYFKGKGGPEKKQYEIKLEFNGKVDPTESKYVVLPRNVPMMIRKKEEGPYWPRLIKEKTKQHWLKTDFDKWRDEDDSDTEAGQDMQLEDMMKQMGNFNTGGGMPGMDEGDIVAGDEEDSDDEELPDLE